jgi:cystathionine beta-synthase
VCSSDLILFSKKNSKLFKINGGTLPKNIKNAKELLELQPERKFITLYSEELVSHAVSAIKKYGFSQFPVLKNGKIAGSIDEDTIYKHLSENPRLKNSAISSIMNEPFEIITEDTDLGEVIKLINKTKNNAVLVEQKDGKYAILTRYDILMALG